MNLLLKGNTTFQMQEDFIKYFSCNNVVKRNKKNTKDTPRKKTKTSTSMDDSRKDLSPDFDTAVS